MNQVKTILDITKKDGEQFKRWAHSVAAAATLNGNAKTGSQFLRSVYNELINNDELPNISKIGLSKDSIILIQLNFRVQMEFKKSYLSKKQRAINAA